MRPSFSLNLPDPRLVRREASVEYETWDPWTSGSSPLHPGWYADPYDWALGAAVGNLYGSDTAMRVSVVNRCVSLIANTIACLPCLLYRQVGAKKERARDHPAYRTVRRKPNAWQTRSQFFRDMQAKVSMGRGAFARVQGMAPSPITMRPLEPNDVKVEQLDSDELRFIYRNPKTRQPETIVQREMLYVRDIAPDFFTGMARATLAKEAIAVSQAAQSFVRRFFINDAGGRLVFKHPGSFDTPEKRDEFLAWLRARVQGGQNAHAPILAYGGMEVQELNKTREEEFLVNPRTFQASDIARFWGVPGFLIGLEEKSTSWGTGIAEQKQGFVDFTIKPETVSWAESLAATLLTDDEQEDYFFEFEFGALLQANPVDQASAFKTYKEIGVFNPDEIRTKINENPREDEGGKIYQETTAGAAPNRGFTGRTGSNVPEALVADAAERLAAATGRAGRAKWIEQVAKVLYPLVSAYELPRQTLDDAANQIADAVVGRSHQERQIAILSILHDLFTADRGSACMEAA